MSRDTRHFSKELSAHCVREYLLPSILETSSSISFAVRVYTSGLAKAHLPVASSCTCCPTRDSYLSLVLGLHELDEIDDARRVAELVVVPRDQLDELVVEGYAGLGVEDARVRVADEVRRDDLVLGVAEDAVERAARRRGLLYLGLDLVVRRRLAETDRQVDHRHVGHGHAERHARELAVQGGDDLADGLGRAGRRGDDVLGGATAVTPQLLGWTDCFSL